MLILLSEYVVNGVLGFQKAGQAWGETRSFTKSASQRRPISARQRHVIDIHSMRGIDRVRYHPELKPGCRLDKQHPLSPLPETVIRRSRSYDPATT